MPRPTSPPLLTSLIIGRPVRRKQLDRLLALDKLHAQALAGVPRDVAMGEPGAGVIQQKGNGQVAARGQGGDVAAHGVFSLEVGVLDVEGSALLGEDPEVVAVEVDGVVDSGGVVSMGVKGAG